MNSSKSSVGVARGPSITVSLGDLPSLLAIQKLKLSPSTTTSNLGLRLYRAIAQIKSASDSGTTERRTASADLEWRKFKLVEEVKASFPNGFHGDPHMHLECSSLFRLPFLYASFKFKNGEDVQYLENAYCLWDTRCEITIIPSKYLNQELNSDGLERGYIEADVAFQFPSPLRPIPTPLRLGGGVKLVKKQISYIENIVQHFYFICTIRNIESSSVVAQLVIIGITWGDPNMNPSPFC